VIRLQDDAPLPRRRLPLACDVAAALRKVIVGPAAIEQSMREEPETEKLEELDRVGLSGASVVDRDGETFYRSRLWPAELASVEHGPGQEGTKHPAATAICRVRHGRLDWAGHRDDVAVAVNDADRQSTLIIVEEAGHSESEAGTTQALLAAVREFEQRHCLCSAYCVVAKDVVEENGVRVAKFRAGWATPGATSHLAGLR
jgi:hypothetical protein